MRDFNTLAPHNLSMNGPDLLRDLEVDIENKVAIADDFNKEDIKYYKTPITVRFVEPCAAASLVICSRCEFELDTAVILALG